MRIFQTLLAFSGNAPPQLAITRRLVARGHEVRVLAHHAARERIERTGAEFVGFERAHRDLDITRRDTDTLRDWESRTRFGAGLRLLKNGLFAFVVNVARECSEQLDSWSPDVVLFDWMLMGAAVAAEGARVPALALVHCPYPFPLEGVPPVFTGLSPMRGLPGVMRDRLLNRIAARGVAPGLPALNKTRSEHGLGPLRRWESQLLGVEGIYMLTAPELDFSSRGALPANVHYVGPAFESFSAAWTSPWPQANTDPLVLVSFSTSYMNQGALAQRVLDALGGLRVRALLTAGPALDVHALRLPANARAVDFIPHRAVLPHAALVVTHTGWQTVNAALAEGVPLVCVPDGRDQPDNAARVVVARAGVRVSKNASPRHMRKVIAAALENPEIRAGAAAMRRALARSDGALAVVREVERLGERASVTSL